MAAFLDLIFKHFMYAADHYDYEHHVYTPYLWVMSIIFSLKCNHKKAGLDWTG